MNNFLKGKIETIFFVPVSVIKRDRSGCHHRAAAG